MTYLLGLGDHCLDVFDDLIVETKGMIKMMTCGMEDFFDE